MELDDGFGGCDALVGDYVLASIVAFCWAVPEESAMEKRDGGGMIAGAVLLLADLNAMSEFRQSIAI